MFCVSNEEPNWERSRFKISFWRVFFLTTANIHFTIANIYSSWWLLFWFSSSLSAIVRDPAFSLSIFLSRFLPHFPIPPSSQKSAQVKHSMEENVHTLFNVKSFQSNTSLWEREHSNKFLRTTFGWQELRFLCTITWIIPSPGGRVEAKLSLDDLWIISWCFSHMLWFTGLPLFLGFD